MPTIHEQFRDISQFYKKNEMAIWYDAYSGKTLLMISVCDSDDKESIKEQFAQMLDDYESRSNGNGDTQRTREEQKHDHS